MRHVIIEGPDGAGKTTLAELIRRSGEYAYHHEGPPPTHLPALLHYGQLLQAPQPTVFDRLFLGELVYGPLFRGTSSLTDDGVTMLYRVLAATGSNMVVCLPPWEVTVANSGGRREMFDLDQRRRAYDRWHEVAARWAVPTFDYTQGLTFAPLVLPIIGLPGVIGSPTADILFVGEQPNGSIDLPFFNTRNSSQYLFERLREADIDESRVAFTNAMAPGVRRYRNLHAVAGRLPRLKVIVGLGKVAEQQIKHGLLGVNILQRFMPHPQYWKRFHASDTASYTHMLREVERHAHRHR